MTSSWFFLSTPNYDARSTTHHMVPIFTVYILCIYSNLSLISFLFTLYRTSPFKSGGGRQFSRLLRSRGVRISGINAGYNMFRGSVKSTGYPLLSPVSTFTSPFPCVTVCRHISTVVYDSGLAVTAVCELFILSYFCLRFLFYDCLPFQENNYLSPLRLFSYCSNSYSLVTSFNGRYQSLYPSPYQCTKHLCILQILCPLYCTVLYRLFHSFSPQYAWISIYKR